MAALVATKIRAPEPIVAAAAPNGDQSMSCSSMIQQTDMRESMNIMAKSPETARIIALPCGDSRTPSKTRFQRVVGRRSIAGVEAAPMQDRSQQGNNHNIQALAVEQRRAVTSWASITQPLLSFNVEISVASPQNADPHRFGNVSSKSNATVADPEETQSLFAFTETGHGLTSPSSIDYASPLQLWLYQISDDNMPMAERLEKSKWVVRRLERL